MKTFILSGSHRESGQTHKVSRYVRRVLVARGHTVHLCSLGDNPLPLWSDTESDESVRSRLVWQEISGQLKICDSVIIATPEWSGMAAPGIMNFLLFLDHELHHKPGLLVSVSASLNGAYPIAELRGFATKNTKLCLIPDHVIVRNVESVLNNESVACSDDDRRIRERIEYSIGVLEAYSVALRGIANDPRLYDERFVYGM